MDTGPSATQKAEQQQQQQLLAQQQQELAERRKRLRKQRQQAAKARFGSGFGGSAPTATPSLLSQGRSSNETLG